MFRSVWWVEAAFADVSAVLADVRTYPAWWPEIRAVNELGHGRFEMVARSLLPYDLRFVSEERTENRQRGVLDARLSGDLEGFARWTIERAGGSCRLVYDQEVDTRKAVLMMRHGQAGLRTYMAGYTRAAIHGRQATGETTI